MKKSFVFGFRQGNKTLSEAEQKRRTEGFRACALQRQHGRNFEPRILGAESEQLGDRQDSVTDERPVIALNFIEARDFNEAVQIAKTHPGLQEATKVGTHDRRPSAAPFCRRTHARIPAYCEPPR